jgi:hypothetical protein
MLYTVHPRTPHFRLKALERGTSAALAMPSSSHHGRYNDGAAADGWVPTHVAPRVLHPSDHAHNVPRFLAALRQEWCDVAASSRFNASINASGGGVGQQQQLRLRDGGYYDFEAGDPEPDTPYTHGVGSLRRMSRAGNHIPVVSLHDHEQYVGTAPPVRYHGTTAKQHVLVPPSQQQQHLHAYQRKPLTQPTPTPHWPSSSSSSASQQYQLPPLRAPRPSSASLSGAATPHHHGDEGRVLPSGPAAPTAYRIRAEVRAALLGKQRQSAGGSAYGQATSRSAGARLPALSSRPGSRGGGRSGGSATPATVSFGGEYDFDEDDDSELTGWPLEALVGQFEPQGGSALPPGMRPLPAGAAARLRHTISLEDFHRGLAGLGVRVTAEEVSSAIAALRLEDAGRILYQRFVSFVAMPAPGAWRSDIHAHGSSSSFSGGGGATPHFSGGVGGHFDGGGPRRTAWADTL